MDRLLNFTLGSLGRSHRDDFWEKPEKSEGADIQGKNITGLECGACSV